MIMQRGVFSGLSTDSLRLYRVIPPVDSRLLLVLLRVPAPVASNSCKPILQIPTDFESSSVMEVPSESVWQKRARCIAESEQPVICSSIKQSVAMHAVTTPTPQTHTKSVQGKYFRRRKEEKHTQRRSRCYHRFIYFLIGGTAICSACSLCCWFVLPGTVFF